MNLGDFMALGMDEQHRILDAASRQSRSKALLDAIEGLRALLSDQSTLALAVAWYADDTGSTSAHCALLRCREHVETIASN